MSVTPSGGNFSAAVPAGPYYVELTSGSFKHYALSSSDTLELGGTQTGRIDGAYPTAATSLQLNLSGLAAWGANDWLSLCSTNVGLAADDVSGLAPGALAAGATSGSLTIDYQALGQPLISSARGDTLVVTQNALLGSPVPHYATVAAGTVTGLTQTSGQPSSAVVAMSPLTPVSQTLDVRTTLFESYRTEVHPQAVASRTQVLIVGVPGLTAARGVVGATSMLLYAPIAAGGTDLNAAFVYGNPFPSSVPLALEVRAVFSVSMQAAGATPGAVYGQVGFDLPLSTLSGPLVPRISPPRNVQVNGMSATVPVSGVGMSPVITWQAPTLGTADRYVVQIYRLENQGGMTRFAPVGGVRTKGTRVVLPPGLLTAGAGHALVISASMNGGIDVEARPFSSSGAEALADAVVGPITP